MNSWNHAPARTLGLLVSVVMMLSATHPDTMIAVLRPETDAAGPVTFSAAHTPDISYRGVVTAQQKRMTEWAITRYTAAGLQLPDLTIEFPSAGCRSRGQYNHATQTIEHCDGRPFTLLHELAHAWDQFADFDREAFLELRDLEHYRGTEVSWNRQGSEHVAEILAWGLMDEDSSVPAPAYFSQPFDEYEPRLPTIPNSGLPQLRAAFVFLTGIDPLHDA